MLIIEFEKLEQTKQQVAQLLGPIANEIPYYRDRDPGSRDTPWEKAYHSSFRVLADYDAEIHSEISGIDMHVRAYHATRLRNINVLQTQGLLQLDLSRIRLDLLLFTEQIIGKPVPRIVIDKWIEETEMPTGYFAGRATSKGPVFSLGVGPMFRPGNTGRYFTEGGEIIYQIAPDLSALLREYEPSLFVLSDEEFWTQYWADATPALVICNLPYDDIPPDKQEAIRRYLMKAALFDDDPSNGYWQGGWIEFSVDQNVPPQWIVEVIKPEITDERISFNPELDAYNIPMYWDR